ncbi:MAG: hypothetical protein K5662_09415 [Lachnospiraceae bacterium]|nr:hypothetical protein [Lachnospiraceae bacterium]
MSRRKTDAEYSKTFAFKFFRWLSGTKDPYVNTVEMTPQKEYKPDKERMKWLEFEEKEAKEKVYDLDNNRVIKSYEKMYHAVAVIFCVALALLLLYTVSYLPRYGSEDRPTNNEVAERYIEQGMEETGAVNVVTGMILTYRAFDTFGETNVLFIATCCVMIMLMLEESVLESTEIFNERRYEPKNDRILQGAAYVLCPVIFIFGIYVILNGQISPGGGFSGGSIMGAGLILYATAFSFKNTERFFNEKVYKVAKITALIMYGLIGSYFYITGANGIANHIPLGIPGHILSAGIILPIDICVGIEVACTMYAFYALFRRGGL